MRPEQLAKKSSYLTDFLKEDYSGFVHSIFTHSLNIQLGKQLVHISDLLEPLSAFGLKIDNVKMNSLLKAVKINNFVNYQNNTLFFYNHLNKIISIISLETLIETELTLKPIDFLSDQELQETVFFKELNKLPLKMKTGLPLSTKTSKHIDELSTYSLETLSDYSIWNHFVGRGIGLTPSGDDFLIGYLGVLTLFNQQKESVQALRPFIRTEQTTDISLAYLTCLLHGVVNENIKDLIVSVYSKDQKDIQSKLEWMLLFGHTSGTDTLYGMFIGMKAMISKENYG
ncbi:Protein of unknown function [Carnobacterium iners]|uniref:DUF2877 domain-containing protein n=1 Tax=Carnobacterium iners TaxID=1073423 RepID=A0A1X7NAY7_9LACT|nr:DUF2877 domain-containing protein [Carnobacterium iners]SEK52431.1 Protein of unknown function [Carnobacterium iners]SMH34750.1 Protein of unknown function [Carnobacterium iners]